MLMTMYGSMTSPVLLPPGGLGRVFPLITCEEGGRERGREGGREREGEGERENEDA